MSDIVHRKDEHIEICRDEVVESGMAGGFKGWRLNYRALPEIALSDVDLSVQIAGKRLRAPIIIGAMTGGSPRAASINKTLAQIAEEFEVGFALGSGRVVIEKPETADTFRVRDVAPNALVFANLGAVQLNCGVTGHDAQRLIETLEADAINLHLNPLQEAIQPGGDTDFRALSDRMRDAMDHISAPVFVKECGAGIGPETAELLATLPIAGVESAGVGGTSWALVEALRHSAERTRAAGHALKGFGVPTCESIIACRRAMPDRIVIGSGGVRSAQDMAVCLALGADLAASALPFLRAATEGIDTLRALMAQMIETLRIIHFVCGAKTPSELRGSCTKAVAQ